MSNYVNDALLDASPYKKQADEAKSLVNKWDKTGLLDGLNEEFQRSGMAVMLENQAEAIIAVKTALFEIENVVKKILVNLNEFHNSRLIYTGAGTSARIGVQDGAESYIVSG